MLRSVKILAQRLPTCSNALRQPFFIRKYLTSAFGCEAAWNKRLESPYIKKIKISDMFYELENQFLHFGKANGIDIDLFANAITDDSHLDEVEDVIHKLRLSPEATSLLPSTQHALVRTMLSYGDVDELLRILDDRLNYGIFMDDYCCILLLNKFLKVENYKNAARVATIHMLQEDFSHPIIKYMSLFACHKYVLNPISWVPEQPQSEENNDDDEEEIRLRVRYIRNPFFDDHFDLRNPSHLVGKTLWMIGNEIPDILGRSYTLLGYTLHEKWDKLQEHISILLDLKEKSVVFKECVAMVQKLIDETTVKENESNSVKNKEEIISLLSKLANSGVLSEEDFLKTTEDKMKQCVSEHEKKTIEQQLEVYDQWEKQRAELINEHIEKLKREKTLKEIEETKQKLKEKEDELFFFENEDKLDMIIENKRVRYPKKWLGKKKQKRAVDAEYVPPEIEKRREN